MRRGDAEAGFVHDANEGRGYDEVPGQHRAAGHDQFAHALVFALTLTAPIVILDWSASRRSPRYRGR